MRELAFVLLLQDLVGPRIDLRQEVALLDQLAFGEADFGELAVDLGLHGHGRERRDGAERIDDDADIAERDGRGADRLQRRLAGSVRRAAATSASARSHRRRKRGGCAIDADADAEFRTRRACCTVRCRPAQTRRQIVISSARSLVHDGRSSIPTFRHVPTYKVRRHPPPNEYSLMTAPRVRRDRRVGGYAGVLLLQPVSSELSLNQELRPMTYDNSLPPPGHESIRTGA